MTCDGAEPRPGRIPCLRPMCPGDRQQQVQSREDEVNDGSEGSSQFVPGLFSSVQQSICQSNVTIPACFMLIHEK